MKTFMVKSDNGAKLEAEQLATFAYYVQGVQFRFVVTRLTSGFEVALTHRESGSRVLRVPHISINAALGDHEVAAKAELKKLIDRVGEARVRSVLAAAEK
jgi:hypothetical protein